eukprot:scaffold7320_cov139-Isochrysis_galbana.AAC.4
MVVEQLATSSDRLRPYRKMGGMSGGKRPKMASLSKMEARASVKIRRRWNESPRVDEHRERERVDGRPEANQNPPAGLGIREEGAAPPGPPGVDVQLKVGGDHRQRGRYAAGGHVVTESGADVKRRERRAQQLRREGEKVEGGAKGGEVAQPLLECSRLAEVDATAVRGGVIWPRHPRIQIVGLDERTNQLGADKQRELGRLGDRAAKHHAQDGAAREQTCRRERPDHVAAVEPLNKIQHRGKRRWLRWRWRRSGRHWREPVGTDGRERMGDPIQLNPGKLGKVEAHRGRLAQMRPKACLACARRSSQRARLPDVPVDNRGPPSWGSLSRLPPPYSVPCLRATQLAKGAPARRPCGQPGVNGSGRLCM